MLELLVTIASSSNHPDFAEWNVIVMQIMFYLLKGSDPTIIASADSKDVSKKEEEEGTLYDFHNIPTNDFNGNRNKHKARWHPLNWLNYCNKKTESGHQVDKRDQADIIALVVATRLKY